MNIIFLLTIISVIVASGFLATFIWAIKSGQYDDDYTSSIRILFDDELKYKRKVNLFYRESTD
jgi:cbb3-type cytochrome oxidase maturation protein